MSKEKSKEEIKVIAAEVCDLIKKQELPIWQAKEVLLYAKEAIEQTTLK